MTTQRDVRRVRLSETRSSWEDQGGSEVAAGKLEVMEKFFTPLPHSAVHRSAKQGRKEGLSSDGMRDPYYTESLSSSPSSSSSPWSSESNFDRKRFLGYHVHGQYSRSCNDLSAGRANRNNYERRDFIGKQKESLRLKRAERDSTERLSTRASQVSLTKVKGSSAQGKDLRPKDSGGIVDKRAIKDGSRRAKSMEVLTKKESKKGQGTKKISEEKKRFSHFLDEITVQVLSPSNLSSLGVKEGQIVGTREQWKSSSTDSSGSKGKRSPNASGGERHELKKKGKGRMEAIPNPKVAAPDPRRNREMSTSPDSASSSQSSDATAQVSIIPPPDWWGDMDRPEMSQDSKKSMESLTDAFNRCKDSTSANELCYTLQDNNLYSFVQNENFGSDKDSLNKKITELLEHLVRAQSTICALEKLNVSSVLSHLTPDTLEAAKSSQQSPDANSQLESLSTSTGISPEVCRQETCGGDLKQTTTEDILEVPTHPRLTAFTPWHPRRSRTLSTLHQLYNSTESECSLDDILPTCKLLSPRFPYLGESFSDDRKEPGSAQESNTRVEQRITGVLKPTLSTPSLLPTHRIPPRSHRAEVSSSESSGEDLLLNWGQGPSQGKPLDYVSAQKILDSLLGITSPNQIPISQPQNQGSQSNVEVQQMCEYSISHLPRTSHTEGFEGFIRSNPKPGSHSGLSQPGSSPCVSPNPLSHPKDNPINRSHPIDSKIPPLPGKRSPLPNILANTFLPPSNVEDPDLYPVRKQEDSGHHTTEALHTLSINYPGYPSEPLCHHSWSPSGGNLIMGSWEGHDSCQNPRLERGIERKPRKERMVHFNMQNNEGQVREGQATQKSKLMEPRSGDQRSGDNALLDSTLL
ncbi:uncharacterized protein O3C94_021954 [Discoglossus pictus]